MNLHSIEENMNIETSHEMIERSGIMAGMRGVFPPPVALETAHTLMDCGINVFELMMNSEKPLEAMQTLKREFGADACVGMGTVLDVETAKRVLDAQPDFVVAPSFSPEVVQLVQAAGVMMIPGVLTATECVDAWALGVKLLKLFPIAPLGADYLKLLRGPLDHMRFMANGGTSDANVGAFIKAGATACGLAGWLTGDGSMPQDTIRRRAQHLREIVEEARTGMTLQRA
jgi:2-dehydro-3-deoxyphosphogluconate aldolase/(4S)-4-hydroxy-2-oxoglutarate aldolase